MERLIIMITVSLSAWLSVSAVGAQSWEFLGSERVSLDAQRASLGIAAEEARFEALKVRVRGPEVWLMHLNVGFADGNRYGAQIRQSLRAGESTREVVFPGGSRALQDVEMVFRNRDPRAVGQTTFQLYGRRAAPETAPALAHNSGAPSGWSELSPAASAAGFAHHVRPDTEERSHPVRVAIGGDRVVRVRPEPWRTLDRQRLGLLRGRGEVRFGPGRAARARSLRFRVEGRSLFLVGLRLGYADGSTRRVMVRRTLRAGEVSDTVRLPEATAALRDVRLHYRNRRQPRGPEPAMISMQGQHR